MRDAMFSGAIRTAVVIAALAAVMPAAAHADTGPRSAQLLAVAQTELVFLNLTQPDQVASPASCDRGQSAFGVLGLFMLPQYVSGTGDTTFDCKLKTRNVLLDLGSAAATEDATGNTYTLADGTELPFRPKTLERICDDVLATGFTAPAPHRRRCGRTRSTSATPGGWRRATAAGRRSSSSPPDATRSWSISPTSLPARRVSSTTSGCEHSRRGDPERRHPGARARARRR